MNKQMYGKDIREKALAYYQKANIVLTPLEKENLEIADFGLDHLQEIGLEIVTYINSDFYCAKEMVLFPHQTCPEHRHAPINTSNIQYAGKQETFRCRYGTVYLYVEGTATKQPACEAPKGYEDFYTVWHEIKLTPGEQYTIMPNIKHWFQGGHEGAIISEFSTKSYDEYDIFTDPSINRMANI